MTNAKLNSLSELPKQISGRWQIGDYLNDDKERFLAVWPDNIQHGERGNPICIVTPKKDETDADYKIAQLIAAAPDLLNAIQELLTAYTDALTAAQIEARNTASDAIQKATA